MTREGGFPGVLAALSPVGLVAGAVGSAGLTLYAGRENGSRLLQVLFVGWVIGPFFVTALFGRMANRWSASGRSLLHGLTLLLIVGSLATYSYRVLHPPPSRAAFVFVVVPIASSLLVAVFVAILATVERKAAAAR